MASNLTSEDAKNLNIMGVGGSMPPDCACSKHGLLFPPPPNLKSCMPPSTVLWQTRMQQYERLRDNLCQQLRLGLGPVETLYWLECFSTPSMAGQTGKIQNWSSFGHRAPSTMNVLTSLPRITLFCIHIQVKSPV